MPWTDSAGDRARDLLELGDLVVVVAAGQVAVADLDNSRRDLAADVGGQRAAVDEHAGRQVGADRRQGAGNRRERMLATCACRCAGSSAAGRRCRGACGESNSSSAAPSSTILPAYITPTRSHIERITPRLWAISRIAAPGLVAQGAHEVEHLGLDRRVETGGRLVEHQQLRVAGQRHRDDDALQHPARQLVRIATHDTRSGSAIWTLRSAASELAAACAFDWPSTVNVSTTCRPMRSVGFSADAGILVHHRRVRAPGTCAARRSTSS